MLCKSLRKAPKAEKMKERSNSKGTRRSYQRAVRFPIQTEIHYRLEGTEDWESGETQNVSRSGVLFNASELLAVNTALELRFPLPTEIESQAGAILLRRGHIVRTILPPSSDHLGLMAASFSDLQMLPSGCEPPEDC